MKLLQKDLAERLSYDPESGRFTWLTRIGGQCRVGGEAGGIKRLGYRVITIDYKAYGAHRLAFVLMTGSCPRTVDHINGDRSDNRWINLRASDPRLNGENQRHCYRQTKGGYLGVARHKAGKWQAQIKVHGVSRYLGLFDTPEAAHEAYLVAKREMHEACTI